MDTYEDLTNPEKKRIFLDRIAAAIDQENLPEDKRLYFAYLRMDLGEWDPIAGPKPEGWDEMLQYTPSPVTGLCKSMYANKFYSGIKNVPSTESETWYLEHYVLGFSREDSIRSHFARCFTGITPSFPKSPFQQALQDIREDLQYLNLLDILGILAVLIVTGSLVGIVLLLSGVL